MSGGTPGDGWHERVRKCLEHNGADSSYDVIEALRMAFTGELDLPTAPYTSILVRWREDGTEREFQLRPTMRWINCHPDLSTTPRYSGSELANLITSFEVLASPPDARKQVRRETAEAVLNRVAELIDGMVKIEGLRHEFGVKP